jgi:hypothetical protein
MKSPLRVTRAMAEAALAKTKELVNAGKLPFCVHRHDAYTPYPNRVPGSVESIATAGMMTYMCRHAVSVLIKMGVPFHEEVKLGRLREIIDGLLMVGESSILEVYDRQEPCINGREEAYTAGVLQGGVFGYHDPIILTENDDAMVTLEEVHVKGDLVFVYGAVRSAPGRSARKRKVMLIGSDVKAWCP